MSFTIPLPTLRLIPEDWSGEDKIPQYIDTYTIPEEVDTIPPYHLKKESSEFTFFDTSKPYIPPNLQRLLDKATKIPLKSEEMTRLIDGIAKISIEFYELKSGKFVAIGFNGRVIESADTQIKLLMKIQGREFKQDIFVWHVGSDSFSGWEF